MPKKLNGDYYYSQEPKKTRDCIGVQTITTLGLNLNSPPAQIKVYLAKR